MKPKHFPETQSELALVIQCLNIKQADLARLYGIQPSSMHYACHGSRDLPDAAIKMHRTMLAAARAVARATGVPIL